jgi:sulfur-carrier protein adenylyltransferase/sulfurtransferase
VARTVDAAGSGAPNPGAHASSPAIAPRSVVSPGHDRSADLNREELGRYSRHLLLPEVGLEGQLRLKSARVLIVGAGGLGSPAALYLAAAGVGTLGIVDFDTVDATNLQRQLLHGTSDVGRRKTDSARDRLAETNPHIDVKLHDERLTSANALDIIREYDIVVDGTDNFATRYLTNDACVLLGKPNVHGAIFRFDGQASVFGAPDGPCYRCLFPEPPPPGQVPSCAEAGVLGALPGIVGTIQAIETIKLILGVGESLTGRLLLIDALNMRFHSVRIPRDPGCRACGTREIQQLIDYDEYCGTANAEPVEARKNMDEMTPTELAERLRAGPPVELIDVREPYEQKIAEIPGAKLIPMGEFQSAIATLDPEKEIVVMCRSGARSARAVQALRNACFARVRNLAGGILRWSDEVDPTVTKY